MALSLAALVSQVENHLAGGTRGQQNYTYSVEQIADEIVQVRAEVILYLEETGKTPELSSQSETLSGILLKPKKWVRSTTEEGQQLLDSLPELPSSIDWHHALIPAPLGLQKNPVLYCGPAGLPEPWSVTRKLSELAYDQHRLLPRRTPIVFVDGEDWWFAARSGRLPNMINVQQVPADPRRSFELGLSKHPHNLYPTYQEGEVLPSFPMSDKVWETTLRRVLQRYSVTHAGRPIQPNDGTALN